MSIVLSLVRQGLSCCANVSGSSPFLIFCMASFPFAVSSLMPTFAYAFAQGVTPIGASLQASPIFGASPAPNVVPSSVSSKLVPKSAAAVAPKSKSLSAESSCQNWREASAATWAKIVAPPSTPAPLARSPQVQLLSSHAQAAPLQTSLQEDSSHSQAPALANARRPLSASLGVSALARDQPRAISSPITMPSSSPSNVGIATPPSAASQHLMSLLGVVGTQSAAPAPLLQAASSPVHDALLASPQAVLTLPNDLTPLSSLGAPSAASQHLQALLGVGVGSQQPAPPPQQQRMAQAVMQVPATQQLPPPSQSSQHLQKVLVFILLLLFYILFN